MEVTLPLDALFSPRSVAVIGASRDPASMGGRLYLNLKESFHGPVYPVNPKAAEIGLQRTYPSVLAVPEPVDLAFIAVPTAAVLSVTRECLEKRVKALVVISAGFSETDAQGKKLQENLYELVTRAGVPMIGPNCLGILDTRPEGPLNGSFTVCHPPAGVVAVGTQSGAFGFIFPEYMRQWNLGITQMVSLGNKCCIGENDLLAHWGSHAATRVIQLYLESFQDPRRFLEIARDVSRKKPIVALKVGRTQGGARAAASHTAALATTDSASDGLLHQAGVIRAADLRELFDVTALLAMQPLPRGRRVGILTNAGGPAVLYADSLEAQGLTVVELSPGLQQTLAGFLPAQAARRNPVDLIGSVDPQLFGRCLDVLLASDEMDALTLIYVPRLPQTTSPIASVLVESARKHPGKTLSAILMEPDPPPPVLLQTEVTIPTFRFPGSAARALARAVEYREWREQPQGGRPTFDDMDPTVIGRLVEEGRQLASPDGWLQPTSVLRLLAAIGVDVPAWSLAHSVDDAAAAAAQMGFPVVLKVVSPTVAHKTEVGGVVLNLGDEAAVREGFARLMERVPDAEGVLVQQYTPGGREVLIGLIRREGFGHLIGLGLGGTLVEVLGEPHFRLCPLSDRDAIDLTETGPVSKLLSARRGRSSADVVAVRDILLRLSTLVGLAPEISEIDFNPSAVLPEGQGVRILDARIALR